MRWNSNSSVCKSLWDTCIVCVVSRYFHIARTGELFQRLECSVCGPVSRLSELCFWWSVPSTWGRVLHLPLFCPSVVTYTHTFCPPECPQKLPV